MRVSVGLKVNSNIQHARHEPTAKPTFPVYDKSEFYVSSSHFGRNRKNGIRRVIRDVQCQTCKPSFFPSQFHVFSFTKERSKFSRHTNEAQQKKKKKIESNTSQHKPKSKHKQNMTLQTESFQHKQISTSLKTIYNQRHTSHVVHLMLDPLKAYTAKTFFGLAL